MFCKTNQQLKLYSLALHKRTTLPYNIMGAGGRASMDANAASEPNQLMQRLAQDPQYAPFYEDTFDVAQFVSSSLTQSSIAARGSSINVAQTQIGRIQEGVTLLDGVVRAEVTRYMWGYLMMMMMMMGSSIDGSRGGAPTQAHPLVVVAHPQHLHQQSQPQAPNRALATGLSTS